MGRLRPGRVRKRYNMERVNHPHPSYPRRWPVGVKGRTPPGLPGPRTRAPSHDRQPFPGLPLRRLPTLGTDRRNRSDAPRPVRTNRSTLPACTAMTAQPTRSQPPSASQPSQVPPFCHFPLPGQMVRRRNCPEPGSAVGEPVGRVAGGGNFRPRLRLLGHRASGRHTACAGHSPDPSPCGLLRLPGFPPRAGRPITAHSK